MSEQPWVQMARAGRPTKRTDELVNEIVARMSTGETLSAICRDAHMPSRQQFYDWTDGDPAISLRIARARENGADAIAEDALTIVDNTDEDPASRRVRADVRLKLLAKWFPQRYGDTAQTNVNVAVNNSVTLTEERRMELIERRKAARAKSGKV